MFHFFQNEFRKLNRFTQKIIEFLLNSCSSVDDLYVKLMDRLFGKQAAQKARKFGVFSEYSLEKLKILEFIKEQKSSNILHFPKNKEFCRQAEGAVILSEFQDAKISVIKGINLGLSTNINRILNRTDYPSKTRNISEIVIKTKKHFTKIGVETKYIDHWKWLIDYFGPDSERTVSFLHFIILAHVDFNYESNSIDF